MAAGRYWLGGSRDRFRHPAARETQGGSGERLLDLHAVRHALLRLRDGGRPDRRSGVPGVRQRRGRDVQHRRRGRHRRVKTDAYVNPLTERYASAEMSGLFSPQRKFSIWRRLWLWLAEEERRLGLPVSDAAIEQMRAHQSDIDFEAAAAEEARTRHDVMAHVRVFGEAAPAAKGIIHWGATSAYVTDNG